MIAFTDINSIPYGQIAKQANKFFLKKNRKKRKEKKKVERILYKQRVNTLIKILNKLFQKNFDTIFMRRVMLDIQNFL